MSGIVGIVHLDGRPIDRPLLHALTHSLAGRGPDAQELWIEGPVGLGHTLLKTTCEAEREHQPCTVDGRTWITADCRIDAREELLRELTAHGRVVRGDAPDPELILHAYAVWGPDAVDHLLGDFAFGIWDTRRHTLFCARDHFGVKPFSYAHLGRTFVFSNTLACVRLHPDVPGDLDDLAIADFLVYQGALDLDRTSFSAIRRLPPAHTLTAAFGRVKIARYWHMPVGEELRYRHHGEYVDHFRDLLRTAVRDRLRTNGVGVFMSGGLDSPSIAATAHQLRSASDAPFDLRAHTVVYDRIIPDEERMYSQRVAAKLRIPIHHYPLDDYALLPDCDRPLAWCPPEPWLMLNQQADIDIHRGPGAGTRVFLRGEGADGLINLPPRALENAVANGEYGRLAREFVWLVVAGRQIPKFGIRTLVRRTLGRRPPPASAPPFPDWLAPDVERTLGLRERWRAEWAVPTATSSRPCDLAHAFWSWYIERIDPGIKDLAAEYRYPYLDVRLASFLQRLPAIPWLADKSVIRVAMLHLLPASVVRRPKAPIAGNPLAPALPPLATAWWDRYLRPSPLLEKFVDVDVARAALCSVAQRSQTRNDRRDVDALRLHLRPVTLNLWLRQRTLTAAPASLRACEELVR